MSAVPPNRASADLIGTGRVIEMKRELVENDVSVLCVAAVVQNIFILAGCKG